MSMERNIITMSESGNILMPDNIAGIWMSEPELVELFGVIAPTLRATIRTVYKSGVLEEHGMQRYIRMENGYYADVFSFPMIVALAFRINTPSAAQVLDTSLQEINSDYEAKRHKDITLQRLEVITARAGLFHDWLKQKGKLGGQHKVPRLSNSRDYIEEMLKLNN